MENDQFQRSPQNSDQWLEEIKDVFNWTISAHGDGKDGKRKGTKLLTLVPTFCIIQDAFIPERNKTITEQTSST